MDKRHTWTNQTKGCSFIFWLPLINISMQKTVNRWNYCMIIYSSSLSFMVFLGSMLAACIRIFPCYGTFRMLWIFFLFLLLVVFMPLQSFFPCYGTLTTSWNLNLVIEIFKCYGRFSLPCLCISPLQNIISVSCLPWTYFLRVP